jgi:hypothetical protein
MGLIRRSREHRIGVGDNQAEPPQIHCPHEVAMTADEAVVSAYLHGRDCEDDAPSQRQLATQFGVSRAKVATLVSSLNGTHDHTNSPT